MPNYSEKLKDPRWQKKRLEVLSRDNWTCQSCGSTENTLHVHHKIYKPHFDPWDYHESSLVTICHICHEEEHQCKSENERQLLERLYMTGALTSNDLLILDSLICDTQIGFNELVNILENIKKEGQNG